jgi:hypothetical protein
MRRQLFGAASLYAAARGSVGGPLKLLFLLELENTAGGPLNPSSAGRLRRGEPPARHLRRNLRASWGSCSVVRANCTGLCRLPRC